MTDTQMIVTLCALCMFNGFALGTAAMWYYRDRQDRKLMQ